MHIPSLIQLLCRADVTNGITRLLIPTCDLALDVLSRHRRDKDTVIACVMLFSLQAGVPSAQPSLLAQLSLIMAAVAPLFDADVNMPLAVLGTLLVWRLTASANLKLVCLFVKCPTTRWGYLYVSSSSLGLGFLAIRVWYSSDCVFKYVCSCLRMCMCVHRHAAGAIELS